MMNIFEKYGYVPNKETIGMSLEHISSTLESLVSESLLKECFSYMDVTSLHSKDTEASIVKLVEKVNAFAKEYPTYPLPASVCVYPNFASVVKSHRCSEEIHVTTVAGCFPTSQSFLEVKVRECELAVENGADEVDIVLALNSFLAGDFETPANEIKACRKAIDEKAAAMGKKVVLKVIIESGVLVSHENIANASFLAMECGADFIKTSTGKESVSATPDAAYVMCECIKKFYEKTGKKVGFKAAGGISSYLDAVCYHTIVASVLGPEWLNKEYFRFGVSRLANNLVSAIEQKTVVFF